MESGVAYCLIFSPSNAWIRLEVACNLTLWSNRKMCYLPHFLSFLFIEQVLRVRVQDEAARMAVNNVQRTRIT